MQINCPASRKYANIRPPNAIAEPQHTFLFLITKNKFEGTKKKRQKLQMSCVLSRSSTFNRAPGRTEPIFSLRNSIRLATICTTKYNNNNNKNSLLSVSVFNFSIWPGCLDCVYYRVGCSCLVLVLGCRFVFVFIHPGFFCCCVCYSIYKESCRLGGWVG